MTDSVRAGTVQGWVCTAFRAWAQRLSVAGPGAVQEDAGVRFSVNIPNFGDFADPRMVAKQAVAAEQAGWDGLFVWDHVLHRKHQGRPFGDPWMLLTAAAPARWRHWTP